MKALSLDQPYATLAAIGAKRFETRAWRPSVKKGEVFAIAATLRYSPMMREMEGFEHFKFALRDVPRPLPVGQIIAIAKIESVISTKEWTRRHCQRAVLDKYEPEYCFGDYGPGRWAWELTEVIQLPKPLDCSGMQRMWDVPLGLEAEIEEQVALHELR